MFSVGLAQPCSEWISYLEMKEVLSSCFIDFYKCWLPFLGITSFRARDLCSSDDCILSPWDIWHYTFYCKNSFKMLHIFYVFFIQNLIINRSAWSEMILTAQLSIPYFKNTVKYTELSAQWKLNTANCSLLTAPCIQHTVHSTLRNKQCKLPTLRFSINCTVHTFYAHQYITLSKELLLHWQLTVIGLFITVCSAVNCQTEKCSVVHWRVQSKE